MIHRSGPKRSRSIAADANGIDLPAEVLDRIDEIVPPGVTINVTDNMWEVGTAALTATSRRR